MKKAYMKPEIMFESFASSTSIAAGCEKIISTQVLDSCGLEWGDGVLFMSTMPSTCKGKENQILPNEDGDGASYDGVCYHVFTGDKNYFNS